MWQLSSGLAANGCRNKFDIHNACVSKQGAFRKKLITEVTCLKQEARSFRIEWDAHGPMTPGLDPLEAEHRLKKYQPAFEVSTHCHGNLSIPIFVNNFYVIKDCDGDGPLIMRHQHHWLMSKWVWAFNMKLQLIVSPLSFWCLDTHIMLLCRCGREDGTIWGAEKRFLGCPSLNSKSSIKLRRKLRHWIAFTRELSSAQSRDFKYLRPSIHWDQ